MGVHRGIAMAKKKTSAEVAREQSEIAKAEGMLGDAFGSLGGLEQPTTEPEITENLAVMEEDNSTDTTDEATTDKIQETPQTDVTEPVLIDAETPVEQPPNLPTGPPTGPPPSGPPAGPPPTGPPTGPPPSGPPTGPPPTVADTKLTEKPKPPTKKSSKPAKPPTGPPTGPPPSGPPTGPPPTSPTEQVAAVEVNENSTTTATEESNGDDQATTDDSAVDDKTVTEATESTLEAVEDSAENNSEKNQEEVVESADFSEPGTEVPEEFSEPENTEDENVDESAEIPSAGTVEIEEIETKEAEIARLSAEVERLRTSMVGAADIIEELENPPMPPLISEDLVIGAHIVADIARMARQLDRDGLIRASMGTIAMLHPERLDVLISTKHKALLPRMNEQDLCAGKLNSDPPRGAPNDWRVLEVLLASTSIVTGGPAAVIHCHGPYATAVSCEKDLVLMQPIDNIGKDNIGKVIIVDPDDENPREYLRQVAEALNQGGMRCVVIRGNGAYAVGADLDQAWANAAMLEHSMQIVMLARQANLKI